MATSIKVKLNCFGETEMIKDKDMPDEDHELRDARRPPPVVRQRSTKTKKPRPKWMRRRKGVGGPPWDHRTPRACVFGGPRGVAGEDGGGPSNRR
jgi:hypothetical protein